MNKCETFLEVFSLLGIEECLSEQPLDGLEKYVCRLYGEKSVVNVNEARSDIFWKKVEQNQ